jgi:molybdopterin molybdotransferase
MSDLLSVQQALERMLKRFLPVSTVTVPLDRSLGRVLTDDVRSEIELPPFTNSGMDGFAVKAGDTLGASPDHPIRLTVIMDIPAGANPQLTLADGQAARIMTGAVLPEGADAVVPIEDTNLNRNQTSAPLPEEVWIQKPAAPGAYLRLRGQDLKSGELVLRAGQRLRPQDLGMLAALGYPVVPVFRRPRIAVLSSGDELVSSSETLASGKIRDSNSFILAALCEQSGAEAIRLGVVKDDPQLIYERLELAIDHAADLIITSAGVSVGAFDYVRQVIEQNGNLNFWRVNIRPGKPLAFGSFRGMPLIGLPGNPVSAYVGFQVFVAPVIRRLSGQPDRRRPTLKVVLDQEIESDGRESYLRAIIFEKCGKITATLASHQGSGNLYSVVKANALILVPAGVVSLPQGAEVEAWLLEEEWYGDEKS